VANKVIEVDNGKLTVYPCRYDDYLYMKSKGKAEDNPFAVLTRGLKFEKKDKGESKASPGSTGKRSSTVA
jgi:ATP-binding cassette subfamily F protein 3